MQKICFIMRGIPGSGKSSVAKRIAQNFDSLSSDYKMSFWNESNSIEKGKVSLKALYFGCKEAGMYLSAIHSADDYFTDENGGYAFKRERLGMAHSNNFQSFKKSCESSISTVICDNTNLTRKDWHKYAACANNLGYIVSFVEMPLVDPIVAVRRNIHSVPLSDIERMISRWEPFNGKF